MSKNPFKVGDVVYLRDKELKYNVVHVDEDSVILSEFVYPRHINDVSFTPFPKPAIPEPNHVRPIQEGYYLFKFDLGIIFGVRKFKHVLGYVNINGQHTICQLPENSAVNESAIDEKKFLGSDLKDYFN